MKLIVLRIEHEKDNIEASMRTTIKKDLLFSIIDATSPVTLDLSATAEPS